MDNAAIEQVTDYIENQLQARILFLPPCSPDLNPCEEVFSKVKSIVKGNHVLFQACQETRLFLTMAFGEVTTEDCNAYISHSGYTLDINQSQLYTLFIIIITMLNVE